MSNSTTYVTGTTITSGWLNDVNTFVYSIFSGPITVPAAGGMLRSNGAAFVNWSSTIADTFSINTIVYASGANTLTGLATANSSGLLTNGSGVPAWVTVTGTGAPVLATSPTVSNLTDSGHPTLEGVTSTGATGSGKLVFQTSPALVTPALGTPSSGTLTNCTGFPTATNSTTFLANDVALNNTATYFSGPNTGSIGANGQTWFIIGVATITDTGGAAQVNAQLHNGTSPVVDVAGFVAASNDSTQITVQAVVSLTAATTFTLKAKDFSANTGVLQTTGVNCATAHLSTSITAIRLS